MFLTLAFGIHLTHTQGADKEQTFRSDKARDANQWLMGSGAVALHASRFQ